MLDRTKKIDVMIALIKKYHDGQFRTPSNIPYWHHLISVAEILQDALKESGEAVPGGSEEVLLAALGHDLYEDTAIPESKVNNEFGKAVETMIGLMTNRSGDHDRAEYVAQIASAPEVVKLIKLADLTENTISASQRVHELGSEWVTTFFRPIIEEMSEQVRPGSFQRFRKTAELLWSYYSFAYQRLIDNTAKWEK